MSWFCLKDRTDRAIATNPNVAAKYLWTTSGIALFISYGNCGNRSSAIATSNSLVGKTTNP